MSECCLVMPMGHATAAFFIGKEQRGVTIMAVNEADPLQRHCIMAVDEGRSIPVSHDGRRTATGSAPHHPGQSNSCSEC